MGIHGNSDYDNASPTDTRHSDQREAQGPTPFRPGGWPEKFVSGASAAKRAARSLLKEAQIEKDAPAAVAKFVSPFLLMEDKDACNMQSVRRWSRELRECLNAVIMGDGSDEGWRTQVAMQHEMGSNLHQSRRVTAALWQGGPQ